MAAYPTSPGFRSTVRVATRTRNRFAEAGTVRQQSLDGETAFDITVEHPLISQAEAATLTAFYDANRYNINTITASDGHTYDVGFVEDYTITPHRRSSSVVNARTRLIGNRQ